MTLGKHPFSRFWTGCYTYFLEKIPEPGEGVFPQCHLNLKCFSQVWRPPLWNPVKFRGGVPDVRAACPNLRAVFILWGQFAKSIRARSRVVLILMLCVWLRSGLGKAPKMNITALQSFFAFLEITFGPTLNFSKHVWEILFLPLLACTFLPCLLRSQKSWLFSALSSASLRSLWNSACASWDICCWVKRCCVSWRILS